MRHAAWPLCIVLLLWVSALHGETVTVDPSVGREPAVRLPDVNPLPEVNPLNVEGDMVVAGSITVSPLTKAIYKRFIAEGYRGVMRHYGIGTGNGFQLFCDGQSDIASASRPIKAAEVAVCAAQNRSPVEFRIGVGAIVVVVSAENDFVDNITLQELAAIFSAKRWSDIKPDWPDQPIELFIPSADRSIFGTMVAKIFDGAPRLQPGTIEPTEQSDSPRVWFHRISVNPYSVGFASYTDYAQYGRETNLLYVEGVAPRVDTVESGTYRLTQPLFLYADPRVIAAKPQVAAFLNFYLAHADEVLLNVGHFPASPESSRQAQTNLLQAIEAAASGSEPWKRHLKELYNK